MMSSTCPTCGEPVIVHATVGNPAAVFQASEDGLWFIGEDNLMHRSWLENPAARFMVDVYSVHRCPVEARKHYTLRREEQGS